MRTTPAAAASPEDRVRRILAERCRIAGAVRAGFSLRRAALEALAAGGGAGTEIATAVDALLASGRLVANESGSRVYLTEAGAAWLGEPVITPSANAD